MFANEESNVTVTRGCMSFIAMFDNAEAYGKANDSVVADPEFQEILSDTTFGEWKRYNIIG